MGFGRTLRLLLPRARATRAAVASRLRQYLDGLAAEPEDVREYIDLVYADLFPSTTRELAEWERQFGLLGSEDDATRRAALAAAWRSTGGQDPRYLEDVVQAAGFPLYIHDWWSSGPSPYVARDPRDYTDDPVVGTVQCGEPLAQCGEPEALADAFLANWPGYLVNRNLTATAPPALPDDATKWPFFIYWGSETFGSDVEVPIKRQAELERLLLKLCPSHMWIVLMVIYTAVSPGGSARITQGGDTRITQGGDTRITQGI